jgi:hypothetical protein
LLETNGGWSLFFSLTVTLFSFSLLFGSSKIKKKKTLRRYVLIHAAALIALYISLLVHP